MLTKEEEEWTQVLPRYARRIGSQSGGVDLRVDRRHRYKSPEQSKKDYEARKLRRSKGVGSLRPAPRVTKLQLIDGCICNGVSRRGDSWQVRACHDDKRVGLGTWPTQQDAFNTWSAYMTRYWQSEIGQERIRMLSEKLKYSENVPTSSM